MTISTETNRIEHTGNGATVDFSFPYKFFEDGDLEVYVDGVLKTLTTDYTVAGAGDDAGGTVTFLVAPVTDAEIVIVRVLPFTQEIDYVSGDPFPAETHEEGLDRAAMRDVQIEEELNRAIRLPVTQVGSVDTELPAPEADAIIAWNATADALTNLTDASTGHPYLAATLAAQTAAEAAQAAAETAESGAQTAETGAQTAETGAQAAQTAAEAAQAAAEAAQTGAESAETDTLAIKSDVEEIFNSALLTAIATTYTGLDIVAACPIVPGDWRKQIHASYMDEDRPSGVFLGSFAGLAQAVSGGATTGDWYYHTGNQNFYEVTDAGAPTHAVIYRAGSDELPALAVAVATETRIIIFDCTKNEPEMWMEFVGNATGASVRANPSYPITSIAFGGSIMYVGCAGSSLGGLSVVDFADELTYHQLGGANEFAVHYTIASRNENSALFGDVGPSAGIVNREVNAVATYLDTAEGTLNDSGVQIPYVLVGTDGGVSQIDPDGTVYDIVDSSVGNGADIVSVAFNEAGPDLLFAGQENSTVSRHVFRHAGLLTTDKSAASYTAVAGVTAISFVGGGGNEALPATTLTTGADSAKVIGTNDDNEFVAATDELLTRYIFNESTPLESLGCYIRAASTTGWMKGDVQAAWLGTTATGSVTGTISDLSGNGNDLTVTGTLTAAAVATGAELTALSGFSATDYAETAAGADGITTGDFCFSGWVNIASVSVFQTILDRVNAGSKAIQLGRNGSGGTDDFRVIVGASGSRDSGVTTTGLVFWVLQRNGANVELYINETLANSFANADDLTDATAQMRLGISNATTAPLQGSLSEVRFSNTPMTAADVARVYRDELKLFQENAACTLSGGSDAVTSLAYDTKRNRVHAATSGGVSVFSGLNRVDSYTGDGALAAHDDLVVRSNGTDTAIDKPAVSLRTMLAELRG